MKHYVKAYVRDVCVATVLYAVSQIYTGMYLESHATSRWLMVLIALVPMAPVLWFMRAIVIFCRNLDELQQRQMKDAIFLSFLVVGTIVFAYGFLEEWGFPKLERVFIVSAILGGWGLTHAYLARKSQ